MGTSSWLTAVKRAFRSPGKDSDKKSSRRKVDHHHEFDEERKSERRRWLFRKQSPAPEPEPVERAAPKTPSLPAEQRHAIAVAAATAAAAEAAVATAKAAVEIIRLTQPATGTTASYKQQSAAKVIQTAFRGYLARKALIALKGIVKLQALIRGQNVRKQANMTLKCMQALLRVQARVRDQRARLSHDGGRRSMFAETSNLWESKYLKDVRDRKSRSRDGSSVTDDWRDCPRTLEELEAILKARNEQEKSLAFAFSQQNKIMESDRDENEVEKWMATKQNYYHHRRESIKTVEIDTLKTPSYSRNKTRCQSPVHRPRPRSPQVRPASPRSDDKSYSYSYSTANTPSLRSTPRPRYSTSGGNALPAAVPNYMAATESAKARIRSQSAPRQRPSTPEREREKPDRVGSVKKRLSYPIPDPYCVNFGFGCNNLGVNLSLRSPSFKSVQAGYVGMEAAEQYSNYSGYTESIAGGEISPCSTTDLRQWLR